MINKRISFAFVCCVCVCVYSNDTQNADYKCWLFVSFGVNGVPMDI